MCTVLAIFEVCTHIPSNVHPGVDFKNLQISPAAQRSNYARNQVSAGSGLMGLAGVRGKEGKVVELTHKVTYPVKVVSVVHSRSRALILLLMLLVNLFRIILCFRLSA